MPEPGRRGLVNTPISIARETAKLYKEWFEILTGTSSRELSAKDSRFSDPTWRDQPVYKRLAQGYLAFCDAVDRVVDDNPDWRKRERERFITGILTSAISPTNTLVGNPAALKRAFETGGMSLVRGARNLVEDLRHNDGMPAQVKRSTFKLGENIAATPGAVVARTERFELLRYQPTTAKVREIPTLIVPPPIGKYYFIDLAPGRSFTEYAVGKGFQIFTMSWRNPQKEQGDWGLDDYVKSILGAVDAACSLSGSKKVNIAGFCAGGILSVLMLAYMAATRDKRINAASFGVMLLDWDVKAPIGALHSPKLIGIARDRSRKKRIHPASSLAKVFAWMRPNDLVWNYWVNNYLTGNDPPTFDILAWSVDGTNLPGKLHGQFLDIFEHNLMARKGGLKVLGKLVDLSRVKVQTLVTGGTTDHLTPWKGCYRTTQLLGGPMTFVLSNAGHVASLVNPPGNPKATYWLGPAPGPDPEAWLAQAGRHTGTWWEVWVDWAGKRSGREKLAPKSLGNRKYKVLGSAPGSYVMAKA